MNTTFTVRDILKYAEEDGWEEGCLPDTGQTMSLNLSFSGKSTQDVIKKLKEFFDVDDDAIELNAVDEDGRVDIARTENADGDTLSQQQTEQWKRGNLKAWYVIYTAYIEQCTPVHL